MNMHWEASILTSKAPARDTERFPFPKPSADSGRTWEAWDASTPIECRTGSRRLVLSDEALAELTASLARHDASLRAFEEAEARAAEDRETAAREIKVTMGEHFNAQGIEVSARRLKAILEAIPTVGYGYGPASRKEWKKLFPAMEEANLNRIIQHSPYCSACKSYAAGD